MDKFVIKLAGRQEYLTGDTLREKVVKDPSKAKIFSKNTLPSSFDGLRYSYIMDKNKKVYKTPSGTVGLEIIPFWEAQKTYQDLLDKRSMVRAARGQHRQGMRQRLQNLYGDLNPGVR